MGDQVLKQDGDIMMSANKKVRLKAIAVDFFIGIMFPSILIQVLVAIVSDDVVVVEEYEQLAVGAVLLPMVFVYWIFVPICGKGQTLGKALYGLKIIDISGTKPSILQILKRLFYYFETARKPFTRLYLEVDEKGRLKHDLLTDTMVINTTPIFKRDAKEET